MITHFLIRKKEKTSLKRQKQHREKPANVSLYSFIWQLIIRKDTNQLSKPQSPTSNVHAVMRLANSWDTPLVAAVTFLAVLLSLSAGLLPVGARVV